MEQLFKILCGAFVGMVAASIAVAFGVIVLSGLAMIFHVNALLGVVSGGALLTGATLGAFFLSREM